MVNAWLAVWGISQAPEFAFLPIMQELAHDAAEGRLDAVLESCFGKVVEPPAKEVQISVFGQSLAVLLRELQLELERSGRSLADPDLEPLCRGLSRFVRGDATLSYLRKTQFSGADMAKLFSPERFDAPGLEDAWRIAHVGLELPPGFSWERVAGNLWSRITVLAALCDGYWSIEHSELHGWTTGVLRTSDGTAPDFELLGFRTALMNGLGIGRETRVRQRLRQLIEEDDDWEVREEATRELVRKWHGDSTTRAWLTEQMRANPNMEVRRTLIEEIAAARKDDPELASLLRSSSRDDEDHDLRARALQLLAQHFGSDPSTAEWIEHRSCEDLFAAHEAYKLLAKLKAGDVPTAWRMFERAKKGTLSRETLADMLAKGWKEYPGTLAWMLRYAGRDGEASEQGAVVAQLARGWKDDARVGPLLKRIAARPGPARAVALFELAQGWMSDPETRGILESLLSQDDAEGLRDGATRKVAIEALARNCKGDAEVAVLLGRCAMTDQNEKVRIAAITGLSEGWNGNSQVLKSLCDCATSPRHSDDRAAAICELAARWNSYPAALAAVCHAAREAEYVHIREGALNRLAAKWSGSAEAFACLQRAATDATAHISIRLAGARGIGQFMRSHPAARQTLMEVAVNDPSIDVRRRAAEGLALGWRKDAAVQAVLASLKKSE